MEVNSIHVFIMMVLMVVVLMCVIMMVCFTAMTTRIVVVNLPRFTVNWRQNSNFLLGVTASPSMNMMIVYFCIDCFGVMIVNLRY